MSYVMAVLATFNNQDSDNVVIKARGRAITTAVDVTEITRNRYMTELVVTKIEIGTEKLQGEEGERNVSSMSISLTRGEKPPKPDPKPEEPEPSEE